MQRFSFGWADQPSRPPLKPFLLICLCLFLLALGVRLLVRQDRGMLAVVHHGGMTRLFYRPLAEPLIRGDIKTFLTGPNPPNDATVIGHPPGYPLLLGVFSRTFSTPETALQVFQLIVDCFAVVLVFLIALEFFPSALAFLAGVVVAVAPNLAFYSLLLTPDALVVAPVLASLLLMIRAYKQPTIWKIIVSGVLLGLSCWLRANALLLAPLFACLVLAIFSVHRLRYAVLLVSSAALVISPITLRNYIVFRHFVPISLGSGIVLIEGIAEYDLENRFQLSASDTGVSNDEARIFNRPDYGSGLWNVDGIEREKRRTSVATTIIKSHPLWYFSTTVRRAKKILEPDPLLLETTIIPRVRLSQSDIKILNAELIWSQNPTQFLLSNPEMRRELKYSLGENGQHLEFAFGEGVYPELIRTTEISVEPHVTYNVSVPVRTEQGRIIFSVTDADHNVLATQITPDPIAHINATAQPETEVLIPFDSGSANKVFLVVNGVGAPIWSLGTLGMYRVAKTPDSFLSPLRRVLYASQKILETEWLMPFALLGTFMLALANRFRDLVWLLVVPLYFILTSSLIHMEHRYFIVIYYVLAILAVVPMYFLGIRLADLISPVIVPIRKAFKRRLAA